MEKRKKVIDITVAVVFVAALVCIFSRLQWVMGLFCVGLVYFILQDLLHIGVYRHKYKFGDIGRHVWRRSFFVSKVFIFSFIFLGIWVIAFGREFYIDAVGYILLAKAVVSLASNWFCPAPDKQRLFGN